MTQLTANFALEEFTQSDTAIRMGVTNAPGAEQRANLERLTSRLLQPLREAAGTALNINSGFRCAALNKAVGGQPTSQHTFGEAADVSGIAPKTLLNILKQTGLDFDQAIVYPTFLHLSYREGRNRKQILYK
jgi:hypothetical protein